MVLGITANTKFVYSLKTPIDTSYRGFRCVNIFSFKK